MMKLTTAIILAAIPFMAFAQNENRRVSIAPHAGVTLSKMSGNAIKDDKTWKTGWAAGAEVEIPLSRYYSILTGADYTMAGTGLKKKEEKYASQEGKINISYVSVPLQIKAYFQRPKGLAFHLGIEAGVMLSAKVKTKNTGIRTMDIGDGMSSVFLWERYTQEDTKDIKGDIRNIIYDIPVGFSYENHHIVVSATYRYEIRQAISYYPYDTRWVTNQEEMTASNHAILITLGYKFKL